MTGYAPVSNGAPIPPPPTGMPPQPPMGTVNNPSYSYVPMPPQKKRKWPFVLIIVFLALIVGLASFSIGSSFLAPKNVALIHMEGTIGEDSGACNSEGLMSLLDQAEADDSIKALVIRVDSGGGYSSEGEEMSEYIKRFSKPVVISTGSTNASAAYFISSQADYIYANASSAVGSIGTIIQYMDYSELLEMLGISPITIESSPSKDSSYGTRPLTEEEIAHYQDQVNRINEVFIKAVSEGRNISIEDVRELATGMTFTGAQGVDNGLVDEIGTLSDAFDKAASLAGLSHYGIVSLDSTSSYDDLLQLLNN